MVRGRLRTAARTRGGGGEGGSRWTSPGTEERPKGYLFNRPPPPPGESRKWEDRQLLCYITSFLGIVILGVTLNAKSGLTPSRPGPIRRPSSASSSRKAAAADSERCDGNLPPNPFLALH